MVLTITTLSLTLFNFKWLIVIAISILYIPQYIIVLNYLLFLLKMRNSYGFLKIKLSDDGGGWISLYKKFLKIESFKKIYIILSKRKMSIINLIKISIIILLNIPVKFLNIIFIIFWASELDIKAGLTTFFLINNSIMEHKKIEIYKNKIYLNCYKPKDFFSYMWSMGFQRKSETLEVFFALQKKSYYFRNIEQKNLRYQEFTLRKTPNSTTPHYEATLRGLHGEVSIQATSNSNIKPMENQFITEPINKLILPKSVKPGTVVTINPITGESYAKVIRVPVYEIYGIIYYHPSVFYMGSTAYSYMKHKNDSYLNILNKTIDPRINVNKKFVSDLSSNRFDEMFLTNDKDSMLQEILNDKILSNHFND